jgi:hypothetical protein
MRQFLFAAALYLSLDAQGAATVEPFPPSFRLLDIKTRGALIHFCVGGHGPTVLMPMPLASRGVRVAGQHISKGDNR